MYGLPLTMRRKVEVSFGRFGVDSRLLSELNPFTPCVGFFLEIQMLTLDSSGKGVMYVGLSQS
jgi:hypothetical protein